MPIEIAGISINRIHKLATLENADFASHHVPGLAGTLFQDTGRHSTRLLVEGIYYGEKASEDLEKLRDVYKKREESDFLAEIVGQAYFSQVVIDRLEVAQEAEAPDQFSFSMVLAEYIPPPQPVSVSPSTFPDIDGMLELDALDFMDMLQLPDLISVPDFGDPTPPLKGVLDGIGSAMNGASDPVQKLTGIFGASGGTPAEASSDGAAGAGAPTDLPVSQQINSIDTRSVTDLLNKQLDHLLEGGKSTGKAAGEAGSKLNAVQHAISGVVPPNIDRTLLLGKGFDSISSLLPTNGSKIFDGLDGDIDTFFAGFQSGLSTPLNGVLEKFNGLKDLGIGAASGSPGAGPSPDGAALLPAGVSAGDGPLAAITPGVKEILATLPEPFDALALINLLNAQLSKIPRENIPLQNIPVLDELRDKLETAIKWSTSDGAGISADLVQTLTSLNLYIHKSFIEQKIDPVTGMITALEQKVDLPDLKVHLEAVASGINQLALHLQPATPDLTGKATAISELGTHITALKADVQLIKTTWMTSAGNDLGEQLSMLDLDLEQRMADLLLLGAPSSDMTLISLAVQPLNQLFENLGITPLITGIHNLADKIAGFIENLNLKEIGDAIQGALDGMTEAIKGFSELLIKVTVEFSMLMKKIENAIKGLGISDLVNELQDILNQFKTKVVNSLNAVFTPVSSFLHNTFDAINDVVAAFDPESLLKVVTEMLNSITDIVSNPTLQDTIKEIRDALNAVNDVLDQFTFTPVTDTVVSGMGVVKDAFNIAGSLPLPDSVGKQIKEALHSLPSADDLKGVTDKLKPALNEIIDKGPKPLLIAIKDKPSELIREVEKYSPDKFIGDQFSAPYQEFVARLEEFKPSKLMAPVKEAMDKLLDELRKSVDPMVIFEPLNGPYQTLIKAIAGLNPEEIVKTLQDKLSAGIQMVTKNLPLGAADEIFNVIDGIAAEIQKALSVATDVRDALTEIDTRFSGLADGETQVREWGGQIAAKMDAITNLAPITAALQSVENSINDIQGQKLQQLLFTPLEELLSKLGDLDPKNSLIAVVQAKHAFPIAKLEALTDSPEKTSLLALLNDFDPMDSLYTEPLGRLQDYRDAWSIQKTHLADFFTQWQERYFLPNGPLSRYRYQHLSLPEIKSLLKDTIVEQLTNAIAPVFKVIAYVQNFISAILSEITSLIQRLEVQMEGILHAVESLTAIRDAINSLVDQLNKLDISFISKEINEVFQAVISQLEALDPGKIGNMLKTSFDQILDALDPDKLLGISVLDKDHQDLINLLKKRDPKVILNNTLQPQYDKIINFLKELDFKIPIEKFLSRIETLKPQFSEELDRVINAYKDMLKAIPDSFGGDIGTSYQSN